MGRALLIQTAALTLSVKGIELAIFQYQAQVSNHYAIAAKKVQVAARWMRRGLHLGWYTSGDTPGARLHV